MSTWTDAQKTAFKVKAMNARSLKRSGATWADLVKAALSPEPKPKYPDAPR